MGLTPEVALHMEIGLAISVLSAKRAIEHDQFVVEEERVRRLCFYGSAWLDHKGKSATDLYVLPWDGKQGVKVTKEDALSGVLELQRKIDSKNNGIKKESPGLSGAGR